jgi:hypothetical protein
MKISKKVALGTVVASILTLGLPMTAANADSSDTRYGGCSLTAVNSQVVTGGQSPGVLGVDAVMMTPANTPDTLAEIDCKIEVGGWDVTEIDVKANAVGVIDGHQQTAFVVQDGTYICEQDIDGNGGSTGWVCRPATVIQGPDPLAPCTTEAGQEICASLTPTTLQGTYSISPPNTVPGPDTGSIEVYDFTVPGVGTVGLPCVVLVAGGTTTDPCAAAGGTDTGTTLATLSDAPTTPLASVRICNADLKLTVDGIGIVSFPDALVVC